MKSHANLRLSEVSLDVVAEVLGLSVSQVRRLVKDGTLPQDKRGRYDLPAVVQAWAKHRARAAEDPNKAVLLAEKTKKLRRENKLAERRMIPKVVFIESIRAHCVQFNMALRALPARGAALLVGKDAATIRDILRQEHVLIIQAIRRAGIETAREYLGDAFADKLAAMDATASEQEADPTQDAIPNCLPGPLVRPS